jgi:hypothetical protein
MSEIKIRKQVFLVVFGLSFCGVCFTRNVGLRDLACLLLMRSKVTEHGAVLR